MAAIAEMSFAPLQFAEHRYYGESKPFAEKDIRDHMQYLTAEQVTWPFKLIVCLLSRLLFSC